MGVSKEQYNEWVRNRYAERRAEVIERLGGKCARCGSTNNLEMDHIDRTQKSLPFEKMATTTHAKFLEELAKCQLLCKTCHIIKTTEERGQTYMKHGTIRRYNAGCRCDECKETHRDYHREYKRKQRNAAKERSLTTETQVTGD